MDHNIEKFITESIESIRKEINQLSTEIAVLSTSATQQKNEVATKSNQLDTIKKSMLILQRDIEEFRQDFKTHVSENKEIIKIIKKDAFPDSDLIGHKNFHLNSMEQSRDIAKIKREVISHIIKGIFWAALVGIFWSVIYSIKSYFLK